MILVELGVAGVIEPRAPLARRWLPQGPAVRHRFTCGHYGSVLRLRPSLTVSRRLATRGARRAGCRDMHFVCRQAHSDVVFISATASENSLVSFIRSERACPITRLMVGRNRDV